MLLFNQQTINSGETKDLEFGIIDDDIPMNTTDIVLSYTMFDIINLKEMVN